MQLQNQRNMLASDIQHCIPFDEALLKMFSAMPPPPPPEATSSWQPRPPLTDFSLSGPLTRRVNRRRPNSAHTSPRDHPSLSVVTSESKQALLNAIREITQSATFVRDALATDDGNRCSICCMNTVRITLQPCSHLGLCVCCALKHIGSAVGPHVKCPWCNQPVQSLQFAIVVCPK